MNFSFALAEFLNRLAVLVTTVNISPRWRAQTKWRPFTGVMTTRQGLIPGKYFRFTFACNGRSGWADNNAALKMQKPLFKCKSNVALSAAERNKRKWP